MSMFAGMRIVNDRIASSQSTMQSTRSGAGSHFSLAIEILYFTNPAYCLVARAWPRGQLTFRSNPALSHPAMVGEIEKGSEGSLTAWRCTASRLTVLGLFAGGSGRTVGLRLPDEPFRSKCHKCNFRRNNSLVLGAKHVNRAQKPLLNCGCGFENPAVHLCVIDLHKCSFAGVLP